MYNPNTAEGIREAMLTEVPFIEFVRHCCLSYNYSAPKNPRILNIGCGWCNEGKALAEFFGGSMVGIDLNSNDIERARDCNPGSSIEFIAGDASNIRDIAPGPYDIIVARNMPPDSGFASALGKCRDESSDSAVIFATFYTIIDFEAGKEHISNAGFKVKGGMVNPYYQCSIAGSMFAFNPDFFGIFASKSPSCPGLLERVAGILRRL